VIRVNSGKSRAASTFWLYWGQGMEWKFTVAFLILMTMWFIGIVTSTNYNGHICVLAAFGVISLGVYLFQVHR
jgi:hypothetical protein